MRRIAYIILVAVVATAAYWVIRGRLAAPPGPEEAGPVEKVRIVTLYFGSPDGEALVAEERTLPSSESDLDNIRAVVEALIAGPRGTGTPTLPASARLRGVFLDGKTAVIDFSGELVRDFSGGTTAEYVLISSLVQTVCADFPEVDAVRVLVDGSEVETIGGHLSAEGPLRPQQWR